MLNHGVTGHRLPAISVHDGGLNRKECPKLHCFAQLGKVRILQHGQGHACSSAATEILSCAPKPAPQECLIFM